MTFDAWGYLSETAQIPMGALETTLVFNEHRRRIFEEYREFLRELDSLGLRDFYQWLDGSFVTMKPFPNDLDLVTFLDFRQHKRMGKQLQPLKAKFPRLDLYFVRTVPPEHPDFTLFESDRIEWTFQFSTSRIDSRTGRKHKKGYLTLNFGIPWTR